MVSEAGADLGVSATRGVVRWCGCRQCVTVPAAPDGAAAPPLYPQAVTAAAPTAAAGQSTGSTVYGAAAAGTGPVRQREEAESMSEVRDRWAAASAYEDYMGRWSRQLAPRFVSWLGIPGNVHWLDVGCGTGALTKAICSHADPASVLGCDPAEPFIEYARRHSQDVRASFVVAGAGALPSRADGYGSVTSLLVLNFLPDSEAAVHEMRSLTATHGAVSACVWDYGGRMEFVRCFWDAVAAVDSTARELDQGQRFPLCRPAGTHRLVPRGWAWRRTLRADRDPDGVRQLR